ncbi:MAG: DUF4276 family protein [Acidimicrobiia bacterium]|nr:DUF4276 family protein [Acidimicrobiia bacterium]
MTHVQTEMSAVIRQDRFIPHLSLHEFEAMLFADPDVCGRRSPAGVVQMMKRAVAECGGGPPT